MAKDDNFSMNTVRKSLALVLIPIFLFLIIFSLIRSNSLSYLEQDYLKVRNSSYSGKITDLLTHKNDGRVRQLKINNNKILSVPYFIYDKLDLGDSIYKNSDSDFEYFVRQKGDTIKRDINKFYRSKYYKKLNKQ